MRQKKSIWNTLMKILFLISLIVVVGRPLKNWINPPCTDVTDMVGMSTEKLENRLEITMVRDSDMKKKINQYSNGEVTTDSASGIGVVYIDGRQVGLHIDSRRYSMYGLHIGDTLISVDRKTTYKYDNIFEVFNDAFDGTSTASFYYNVKRKDCLVVICNDRSNRIVALTYFNDLDKITERLSKVY